MANGWTNANNFKPWTQYDITPGAEDIVIPKGSYLSQDITVHGDPNYASCNIVQGASVGDIQYGSANTPINSFGGGVYYPKNQRTPYAILDNLVVDSEQNKTDFNNHIGVFADSNVICIYPELHKYKSNRTYTLNYGDDWNGVSFSSSMKAGRIDAGIPVGFSTKFSMISNLNNGNPIGCYTFSGTNYMECNLTGSNSSSYATYHTCFLLPINNQSVADFAFIGLIRNGNSYAIITSKNGDDWNIYNNFTTTQDFVGVERTENETFILFSGGSLYQFSDDYSIRTFVISTSNYSMIDLCGNKKDDNNMFAISKNKIYRINGTGWTEIVEITDMLQNLGIQITSEVNYTEWMTYIEYSDEFVIGSSQAIYVFNFNSYSLGHESVNWYTDLSFIESGLEYLPCHCFLYINNDISGKSVVLMYYNFIYVMRLNTQENYVIYPFENLKLRIRG